MRKKAKNAGERGKRKGERGGTDRGRKREREKERIKGGSVLCTLGVYMGKEWG